MLLFVGGYLYVIVQQDFYVVSVYMVFIMVGQGVFWFSYVGGIKSIVQVGSQMIQVYIDQMEIFVDQLVIIISLNDEIYILVKEKIVLQVG